MAPSGRTHIINDERPLSTKKIKKNTTIAKSTTVLITTTIIARAEIILDSERSDKFIDFTRTFFLFSDSLFQGNLF